LEQNTAPIGELAATGTDTNMSKKKILFLIPFLLVLGLLLYCWAIILTGDVLATWRHYVGLFLFIPLIFLFFKSFKITAVVTGLYLLLATFNLLAVTPSITTSWINIGSNGLQTPPVQLGSLGILVLYFVLNMDTLIDIQLDYREARERKSKAR
jgi:hypothetical protein